jgi:hypothetical protein
MASGDRTFLEKRDTSFISEYNNLVQQDYLNIMQIGTILIFLWLQHLIQTYQVQLIIL